MNKGAVISDCGRFRYSLWRIWDDSKPKALFVLLNPSTADADNDDATVRRLIGFCKRWDYGGFYITNAYPLRTKSPAELREHIKAGGYPLPVHERSRQEGAQMAMKCDLVVVGWGANGTSKSFLPEENYRSIIGSLPLLCFGYTKDGNYPRHPLYLPYNSPLYHFLSGEPYNIKH